MAFGASLGGKASPAALGVAEVSQEMLCTDGSAFPEAQLNAYHGGCQVVLGAVNHPPNDTFLSARGGGGQEAPLPASPGARLASGSRATAERGRMRPTSDLCVSLGEAASWEVWGWQSLSGWPSHPLCRQALVLGLGGPGDPMQQGE